MYEVEVSPINCPSIRLILLDLLNALQLSVGLGDKSCDVSRQELGSKFSSDTDCLHAYHDFPQFSQANGKNVHSRKLRLRPSTCYIIPDALIILPFDTTDS
jgi:hypothetical protein